MDDLSQRLLVLGAGPKGCAIWAKYKCLVDEGVPIGGCEIVEKDEVAHSWSGASGYTDGLQLLVSPSEQDVGFPYPTSVFDSDLSKRLTQRMFSYSWQNYLLTVGGYPEWILQPHARAPHFQFADYLRWVARASGMPKTTLNIDQIKVSSAGTWALVDQQANASVTGSGLVITGSGPAKTLPDQPAEHERIMDGKSFWKRKHEFKKLSNKRIAVVGAGETAGAIANAILDEVGKDGRCVIELICKQFGYFTRADAAKDLVYFSDPSNWRGLKEIRRFSIIRRADRGVVSASIKKRLEESELVEYTTAEVKRVIVNPSQRLALELEYDGETEVVPYDYIVVATGFDAFWFFDLFNTPTKLQLAQCVIDSSKTEQLKKLESVLPSALTAQALLDGLSNPKIKRLFERAVERIIGADLSVNNFTPKLHLPMFSALAQGPGFPNLNCLGLLSDRILKSYLS